MSEKIYDEEIAPMLMQVGKRCEDLGLSMVAVVEYEYDKRGTTRTIAEDAGLAMRIVSMAASAGQNVDSLMIGILRYCKANDIPTDSSMFLARWGKS